MGNEHSTPERTEKCPVFESPVILPLPEKELDDGGVYKGDQPNDRILKVSEILRKSLEMDIEENGVTSNDSMTENGCDVTPQSPTFRSSITIHLTPCVEYLQSPDTESTSHENTDIKTDQAFHNEDRQTGESDQVLERNIDKTISNSCMSRRENTLCNGYTSDMKGHIHAGVAQEGEDEEIVRVEKVKYHRGNSNIDEYIEKAKNLAVKTNGLSADVSDSGDKVAQNDYLLNGSDKIDQELMEVKKNAEVLSFEPSQENCENHTSVSYEINLESNQDNEKHAVISGETMPSAQVQENGGNYSPVVPVNSDLEHEHSEKQILTVGETRPSEPAQENEEESFEVQEEIIPSNAASVHAEKRVENAEANLPVEHTHDQEDKVDDLEIKVFSEVIKKDEIQRQTSAEEQREKSKKKHHSPLSKFGVKFNEAWKSIKPKRRESMEKSKTRVAGAYAAEHDFTVNHASPTKEKSAFEWEEPNRTKVNIIQTNGISFEGATQKAYAICNEYAYVVRKQSYSDKINVPSEFAEDKDIESDAISDIDEELVAKSTRDDELSDFDDGIDAEKQGPVYVGLIVKDANEGEENPADLEGLSENGEESITASFNIDTQHEKTNDGLNSDDENETTEHELEGCVESTHTDILHVQPIADESTGTQIEKMEIEKPTESTQKSTSPTKVKKKNSILKYLLHSPKKSKTKKKDAQSRRAQEVTIIVDSKTETLEIPSEDQHTRNTCADNIDPLLTYVECREKDVECAKESDKSVESREENSSTNSSAAEFDEVDLNSTSDTHSNLDVKVEDLKDSLPKEEIILSVSQEDVEIQDNAAEEVVEKETANLALTIDKTELKTTENFDIEKTHLNDVDNLDTAENDSHLIEKVDDGESGIKNLPQNIEIDEKSDKPLSNENPMQEITAEPNLEESEFNENQAVVIDVTCSDDNDIIVDGTDHDIDVIQRQEKRKLPDEENDSPELQSPSGSPSESFAMTSQSAKSSPTRKKKKKRTNSLSAKISDFFGVGEFRRRISTHSNKSDKSPHEEKNIWSPTEKQTERKQSGSSLHEEVNNSIPEIEATCSEIQEEIIPERSLEAKSMPALNIEHSGEGGEKDKTMGTHVKMRGRGKEKRSKRNSFLESLGLHTSKTKKRPVISSPIRQNNRKSLFDDEIQIDVDQDLHIISLSDDENDPNATPRKSKDSDEIKEIATKVVENHPDEDKVEATPTVVSDDDVEKPEKDGEENNTEAYNKDTNSEEKTDKDDLNLPISKEEGSDESKQEMKISMVERKLSPGEYVSLEQAPESTAEAESVTDYLKFEQEDSELSPEIEGKEFTLELNGEKNGDVDESCDLNLESSTESSELENVQSSVIEAETDKEIKPLDTEDKSNKDNDVTDISEGENSTESTVTNSEAKSTDEKSSMNANSEEEILVSRVESTESADKKEINDKEVGHSSPLNEKAKTIAENENSANISNDVHSEDSQNSHHITVKATIETPPVSNEIDLCEVMKDRVAECDALCNDAEYDSIKVEEERTVAIENPNYCATCPVENKSPSDIVDNLHSQADGDVNGQDESLTLPATEASTEERKFSEAAARSASMEELTVHSSHIYEEIEKKRPIIYRRFSDKTENRKVICTSPEPDGKKVKKKKSRSSSFSEFFRNPTKYKMPAWRHKKTKEIV